ncbi:Zinc finger, FYVE/PHD-type [Penicillium digitatum]|uniref:Zinc finger, FYVE/PHD-type n=1 Tax=Penicillium digitatum TaxID=36651 RepID=A0A7T7BLJ5_PENDI|nr:Zinc finger, FYVE/PHD-type [Penicillium digitatum]
MARGGDPENTPEGFSKCLKPTTAVLPLRSMPPRQSIAPALAAPAKTTAPKAKLVPKPAQELSPLGPVMITHYSKTQQEKARTLFAKYGLTIDTGDWKTPPDPQLARVMKPIRMRVRRTCHRCETTFGAEKICINCQHTRCTKCPRDPAARNKDGDSSMRKPMLPETYVHQPHLLPRTSHLKLSTTRVISITMSSPTGGQDFIHRPVRQRVHRYCHLCTSVFTSGSKECSSCSHVRCKICPRDPAKLNKYPDGYAGDVDPPKPRPERTFKKPRCRVHYECHVCEACFPGNSSSCAKCGQAKCDETKRIPPKKDKPDSSPEVRIILKGIEEKLAQMALQHTPDIVEATAWA